MRRKAMMAKPAITPSGPPMASPPMKKGGKAEGGKMDTAQDKAMIKKAFKQHDMQEHKGGKGTDLKLKKGGMKKYATGGLIPSESSSGNYDTTKVYTATPDRSPAKTGDVKMGNAGGFKRGGKAKKMATGGVAKGQGGYATGGAIPSEESYGNYDTTKVYSAKPDRSSTTTGGVSYGNAGGFKAGGKSSKKAYAAGGTVDSGRPVAMPQGRKPVPSSVKISQLAGTYKKGGRATPAEARLLKNNAAENSTAMRQSKTDSNMKYGSPKRMAGGGATSDGDKYIVSDPKAVSDKASRELEEALNPLGMIKELYGKARNAMRGEGAPSDEERRIVDKFRAKPSGGEGSVTEREKSITVSPAGKKRGGRAC
jgi:hypothetical protein